MQIRAIFVEPNQNITIEYKVFYTIMTLVKIEGKLCWDYIEEDDSSYDDLSEKYPYLPVLYRRIYRNTYRWKQREYKEAIKKLCK